MQSFKDKSNQDYFNFYSIMLMKGQKKGKQ